MISRSIAIVLLVLLAACSAPSPQATAEATSESSTNGVAESTLEASPETVTEATSESSAESATEAVAESTEASSYQFVLDAQHTTPLNFGGTASFSYPSAWRLQDTSQNGLRGEITLFGVDNYSFSFSFNNDPANRETAAQDVLNMLNQTAEMFTVEREGRTIYHTLVRGGHAFAAAIYVDGNSYAVIEMVNTRQGEFEPMQETAFAILLSITFTAGE